MDGGLHFLVGYLAFDYGEHLDLKFGLDARFIWFWDGRNRYVEVLALDRDVHIAEVGISVFFAPPALRVRIPSAIVEQSVLVLLTLEVM